MKCLNEAWQQHAPELRSWMRRRLACTQDADDLMQDLFIKAWHQGTQFCAIQNPRAWLFEVARNALADRLKVKREMVALPEELPQEDLAQDAVDQLSACLPRVLGELPPADRQAIELCDLQGLSQAEYALKAGLTLSAAKSRLQRARLKLQKQMSQACQVQLDELGHVEDFVPRPPLS